MSNDAAMAKAHDAGTRRVRLRLGQLCSGMVLAEPIYTPAGVLLGAAGYAMTVNFIANLRKLKPGTVREPVVVLSHEGT